MVNFPFLAFLGLSLHLQFPNPNPTTEEHKHFYGNAFVDEDSDSLYCVRAHEEVVKLILQFQPTKSIHRHPLLASLTAASHNMSCGLASQ